MTISFIRKTLFLSLLVAILTVVAHAQEYAVFEFRVGKQKERHRVVIQLLPENAPATVANFQKLVKKGFYKKQAIHRAIPDYLVQLGDPLSRKKDRSAVGTGGPGYTLPAEGRGKHIAGTVAMARLPDNINVSKRSNGSQFYIMLADAPELNNYSTVFGKVVDGLEFLQAVSKKNRDSNDYPTERITVRSVHLENNFTISQ